MSNISKNSNKRSNSKVEQARDEVFAYKSVIRSAILTGVFFIFSILFNLRIITFFMNRNLLWDILDVMIKTILILLFFFFMMVSLGNYKELVGNPLNWKEILLIIILSLGQSILNPWVFTLTLIGIILVLIYLFLIQEG